MSRFRSHIFSFSSLQIFVFRALQRALQNASKQLAEEILTMAKPVESNDDILNIATIATGNEAMGRTIANCFRRVGKNGATMVEDGQTLQDEIEFTEGMEIDRGYVSPYFVTRQESQAAEFENPRILVTDYKITRMQDLVPILEEFVESREPLVIIADEVTGDALSSLVLNKMRGVLNVVAIKAPSFGERRRAYLEDIAIVTGATFVTEQLGITLDSINGDFLGTAARISVTKDRTTMIATGNHSKEVDERMEKLRSEKEQTDSEFDTEKLEERIARLGGAIGRIKVGAATETELKDKKLRYEDALNSVKSAMEEGIVPGGGAALVYLLRHKERIQASFTDPEEKLAVDILFEAMKAPMEQIAENAGVEGAVVIENCKDKDWGYGYNAATDVYEDLLATGVVDPATVTRQAVLNAGSIAASVITTSCLISPVPDEEDTQPKPQKNIPVEEAYL